MIVSPHGFHFMMHLYVVKKDIFVVFMCNVFLNDIFFYSLSCSVTFLVIFFLREHFCSVLFASIKYRTRPFNYVTFETGK